MAVVKRTQREEKVVFGLDIGTRSVVGTVGYLQEDQFYVIAQKVRAHETRAMLDGQIHDIGKVSSTIRLIKAGLENETGIQLTDVCIAAAGRVLRTIQTSYEEEYEKERAISEEDIYNIESKAVEKAYGEFLEQSSSEVKFFLVGYTVKHYYMNGYQIANLEGHTVEKVKLELIATFLPQDVVDGLYKACERAGLQVANLTLEPIAAIRVAIPEKYRMLNLALIDVGAGTSDICVTNEGTIMAYGMIPEAGDHLTETIAQECLVDFNTADQIKIDASTEETVTYSDIMGIEKTINSKEINKMIKPQVDAMAQHATEMIMKLNGDKPVQAVFVVGGGGRIPGYTSKISKLMDIPAERVALRGEEVMKNIVFPQDDNLAHDSLLVTPLGICLSYYEESNNFVFVSFNGVQTKIYDNGRLAIVDAAMQASFPNEDLFPKRGPELKCKINGQARAFRGNPGEAAVIRLNGQPADIHSRIHANDIIEVDPSTEGDSAKVQIGALAEFSAKFVCNVNGKNVTLSRFATVNGEPQTAYYEIRQGDDVKVLDYNTAGQIAQLLDIDLSHGAVIVVNNESADVDTPVYENFKVEFKTGTDAIMEYYRGFPDADEEAVRLENEDAVIAGMEAEPAQSATVEAVSEGVPSPAEASSFGPGPGVQTKVAGTSTSSVTAAAEITGASSGVAGPSAGSGAAPAGAPFPSAAQATPQAGAPSPSPSVTPPPRGEASGVAPAVTPPPAATQPSPFDRFREQQSAPAAAAKTVFGGGGPTLSKDMHVIVNNNTITLKGKMEYLFVDVFDYIDFDLTRPEGRTIVTEVNGKSPDYMQKLNEGDKIEIYWKKI